MYPVLFRIGSFEARSYYVLWAFALLLFLRCTFARCTKRYGADPQTAMSALLWVYCCAIGGAVLGGVLEKLPLVLSGNESVKILLHGGASSGFGILSGGIAGILRLRGEKFTVSAFADAASLPVSAMLSVGRIGCLLEGCCKGIVIEKCWYALHFPQDMPGVFRFPSQPLEAFACALIFLFLCFAGKKLSGRYKGAVLFPLFLILYGAYRLFFDAFREPSQFAAFKSAQPLSLAALLTGVCWLVSSLRKSKDKNC